VLLVQHLKRLRIPLFGPVNRLSLTQVSALLLFWLGQLSFSGRTHWDAA
jgi:hypothetical protein